MTVIPVTQRLCSNFMFTQLSGSSASVSRRSSCLNVSDPREATSGEVPDERLLFPELTDSDISEIHIRAGDDCAFDFSLRGELSVNGQKADGEVFSTLLDQLTADCFVPCEDFEPRGEPLLTVTVSTDTQDFSARFYQDSEDGKYAYVVAGADKERCLKTDAWRVGTLLLTCEGTRIFDASGQETPVD